MSPENKQRIIGIIILIAFVALLIPFLFTSEIGKKISKSDQIPMNQEQRQLATEQIESTNNQQQEALIATNQTQITSESETLISEDKKSSENTTPQIPQASVESNDKQSDVSFPPELSNNNQAIPASPSLPALQSDEELINSTNATTSETAIKEQSKSEEKIDKILSTNKAINKNKAKNKIKTIRALNKKSNSDLKKFKNWSVQVGSFSNSMSVNKLVSQLRDKGFKAYLQKVTKNNITMTRVLVGSEKNKQEAKQIADKLNADLNMTGYVVRS